MSRSAYPTAADLESYLLGAGIVTDTLDCATAAAAGRRDFESLVGTTLLSGAESTRCFDPPARELLEIGDLQSLTSVVYRPNGGSPEALAEGVDFWPEPYNAADCGEPYTLLRFRRRWPRPLADRDRRSIEVAGAWGYGPALSEELWEAMLCQGCLYLMPQIVQNLTEGLTSLTQGGVTVHFGDRPLDILTQRWQGIVKRAARPLMRLRF